jgi:hypothetical protein
MNRQTKLKPGFKIQSVDEFVANGGNINRVDYAKAHCSFSRFGRTAKMFGTLTSAEAAKQREERKADAKLRRATK